VILEIVYFEYVYSLTDSSEGFLYLVF